MDRLTEMEAFVQVVDHGGFTDAARKMGLSKSAVSKHVSALEGRLAVRLLNRTTRRVSPTEVGLAYYDRARQVLTWAGEADNMVTAMQAIPKGALRVSAPISFGVSQIAPAVAAFLAGRIGFLEIAAIVADVLSRYDPPAPGTIDAVLAVDAEARTLAEQRVKDGV